MKKDNKDNNEVLKLLVFGLVTTATMSMLTFPVSASATTIERPMAGITLSLDKYYINNDMDDATKKEESKENTDSVLRSFNLPQSETEELEKNVTSPMEENSTNPVEENAEHIDKSTEEETEPEEEKRPVLNLNYDRLGIAKVDNYLNIREKPSQDSKVVGKLPKDAGCHVYEIDENGWAKIISNKVSGYVLSTYLVLDEAAEEYAYQVGTEMAVVNTETLNVRFLPSTDSGKYTLVPNAEEMEVVKENLTEEFVNKFIQENFSDEENKALISNVDKEEMMKHLEDWMCVTIDNEKVFVAKEFVDVSYQLKKAVFVEEVKEDVSKGVTSVRANMVEFAKKYLGKPYVYGGTSLTGGIDCSGYTMRIYQQFGYSIPRTSGAQSQFSRAISDPKPGDLFFYGNGSRVNHVAMYIGNGQVIHASNPKTGIKISNAYYRTPMKIGRIIND